MCKKPKVLLLSGGKEKETALLIFEFLKNR
jgi:hypothetical protein